jgi:hypothetical protein
MEKQLLVFVRSAVQLCNDITRDARSVSGSANRRDASKCVAVREMRHAAATTATFEASFKIVIWVIKLFGNY